MTTKAYEVGITGCVHDNTTGHNVTQKLKATSSAFACKGKDANGICKVYLVADPAVDVSEIHNDAMGVTYVKEVDVQNVADVLKISVGEAQEYINDAIADLNSIGGKPELPKELQDLMKELEAAFGKIGEE